MHSLKQRLILTLVALLAVTGLLAGGIAYKLALADAEQLLDRQLVLVGRSIHEGSRLPLMREQSLREAPEVRRRDMVIQVSYPNEEVRCSRPDFDLPVARQSGFSDIRLGAETWRAYTLVLDDRIVQISQSFAVREEIAAAAAWRTVLPFLGLLPLAWLLVTLLITRLLAPLDQVAHAAAERDASSLTPLPSAGLPQEVQPLIAAINQLLARLDLALTTQRQFMLDAAHELRTPLAALQLQIENLDKNRSPADLAARIDELLAGSRRASHLVGQLLKIARYESRQPPQRQPLSLNATVKACLGELIPLAEQAGIDLGMTEDQPLTVCANPDDLRVLITNLINNAIRYSGSGASVDIEVRREQGQALLRICDSGPGIAEALLPRVFDRFFRAGGQAIEGSGIGLAIVQAIATQEGATVTLANRRDRSGLCASVRLPLA